VQWDLVEDAVVNKKKNQMRMRKITS
jgi:hypothetical protein